VRCFYHNDVDAVGTCSRCGKATCRRCVEDVGGALLCANCRELGRGEAAEEASQEAEPLRRAIRRSYIIAGITFVLCLLPVLDALSKGDGRALLLLIFGAPFVVYMIWSWYWGYRALNRFRERVRFLLIMPLIGWLIYFELKLCIAGMYGICGGGIHEYLKTRRLLAAADHVTASAAA